MAIWSWCVWHEIRGHSQGTDLYLSHSGVPHMIFCLVQFADLLISKEPSASTCSFDLSNIFIPFYDIIRTVDRMCLEGFLHKLLCYSNSSSICTWISSCFSWRRISITPFLSFLLFLPWKGELFSRMFLKDDVSCSRNHGFPSRCCSEESNLSATNFLHQILISSLITSRI